MMQEIIIQTVILMVEIDVLVLVIDLMIYKHVMSVTLMEMVKVVVTKQMQMETVFGTLVQILILVANTKSQKTALN